MTSTRSERESPTNADQARKPSGPRRELVPDGYLRQWERLAETDLTVIAVRDNPRLNFRIPECIETHFPDLMRCARPRGQFLEETSPVAALQPKPANVDFIDLTDRFCDREWCYPAAGNIIIYSDGHHITASYSRSLASILGERMKEVRPDLFSGARRKAPPKV